MTAELVAVLFSWAMTLSGMHADQPPEVAARPHAFFVTEACAGHECKVYGWYAHDHTVYIDERMDPADTLASSIIVHEMVHFLQHEKQRLLPLARGAAYSEDLRCGDAIELELEAYGVQREFLRQYGVYQPVGQSMLQVGCAPAAASVTPSAPETPVGAEADSR